jgi:hypothetical protein
VTTPTGSDHFSPQTSYDAFEYTGNPEPEEQLGSGLGAAVLLADSNGDVQVLSIESWKGTDHTPELEARLEELGDSGFFDIVVLVGGDITPLYPKTSNLVIDVELDFSNVFFQEYNALPTYSHYLHQSIGTTTHLWDDCKHPPCDLYAPNALLHGISRPCSENSRTSVLFADALVPITFFSFGNEIATTSAHEALHYFDLNTPRFLDTDRTVSCEGGWPEGVCPGNDDDPPWCGDHSIEGPYPEPIPSGLPAEIQAPGLMSKHPDDDESVIRFESALSTSDPSQGAAGRPATTYRLRNHDGLREGN